MSKRLRITARGKTVLAACTVLVVSVSAISWAAWKTPDTENYAEEVYSYAINTMLEESKENESDAREELRELIEKSNTLLKDTDGKIFDVSRTNLQTYLTNVKEIPDSQIIESDNFVDYVNSEIKISAFIANLSEKNSALQTSYDNWKENRNEFVESSGELEEVLTSGISSADELERKIRENIEESERIMEEREEEREQKERERREQSNRPSPTQPTVPKPPVETSKPTVPPSPSMTPTPSPVKPSPTEKPSPTTAPEPSSSPYENKIEEDSMIGQDNG